MLGLPCVVGLTRHGWLALNRRLLLRLPLQLAGLALWWRWRVGGRAGVRWPCFDPRSRQDRRRAALPAPVVGSLNRLSRLSRWQALLQLRRRADSPLLGLTALATLALVGFGLWTGAVGIAHCRAGLPRVGVAARAEVGGTRALPAEFAADDWPCRHCRGWQRRQIDDV